MIRLIMVLTIASQISPMIQTTITQINTTSGVLFEVQGTTRIKHGEWIIKTSMNIKSLKDDEDELTKLEDLATQLCAKPSINRSTQCMAAKEAFKRLKDQTHELIVEWMEAPCKRYKRSPSWIGLGGKALKTVFGTMNEEDESNINNALTQLQENQGTIKIFIDKQTSTIDSVYNITAEHLNRVDKQMKTTKEMMSRLLTWEHTASILEKIDEILTSFELLAQPLYFKLQTIKELLQNKGTRERMIKKSTLLNHLKSIESQTEHRLPLKPTHETIDDLYELAHQKVIILCSNIVILTIFPLVSAEAYKTYKITPIPVKLSPGVFTIITTGEKDVLLTEQSKNQHISMSASELFHCEKIRELYICDTEEPILTSDTGTCFIQLLLGNKKAISTCNHRVIKITDEYFIKLLKQNTWAYTFNKEVEILEKCEMKETRMVLKGSGILTIPVGCVIITKRMVLAAKQRNIESKVEIDIPQHIDLNKLLNTEEITHIELNMEQEEQDHHHLNIDSNLKVQKIGQSLKELRQSFVLNKKMQTATNTTVGYTVGSCSIVILLGLAFIYLIKYKLKCKSKKVTTSPEIEETIEIQEMPPTSEKRQHSTTPTRAQNSDVTTYQIK